MKIIKLCVLILTVAFATACPKGPSKKFPGDINTGSGPTNTKSLVTNINGYLKQVQLDYKSALDATPPNEEKARRLRDDAIFDVLAVIDDNYTDYISNIESRRSKTDFILDVIDLGAGAATGISKGERPNQILGIAMTAFRGGRKSAELNFYKQQTTPILISKMDDNRSTVLADILERQEQPTSNYSLKAAIRDLVDYYNGGTLVRAFTELAKSTAVQAQSSQNRVANVRRVKGPLTVSAITTIDIDRILKEIDKQKSSLAQQIATAEAATPLLAAGAPGAAAAQAARTAALEPVRQKLETIWKNIEGDAGKFDAAITRVRADNTRDTIIQNIDTAPTTVPVRDYLRVLFALQGELNKDPDLSRELLRILTTANP